MEHRFLPVSPTASTTPLIQPYSGHDSRTSLEIYSKITIGAAQDTYDQIIDQFPV